MTIELRGQTDPKVTAAMVIPTKDCPECGKTFSVTGQNHKFCEYSCMMANEYRRRKARRAEKTKTCRTCRKEYKASEGRRWHCSWECTSHGQRTTESVRKECPTCGRGFLTNRDHEHCSVECSHYTWRNTERGKAVRKRYREMRNDERRRLVDKLKDEPCTDCGGRFPPEAMDFDHVKGEKVDNVSRLLHRGFDVLMAEIEKCDLVCANCHRIRTVARLRES